MAVLHSNHSHRDAAGQGQPPPASAGATTAHSIGTSDFDRAYVGTPPWDIGRPQPAFVSLAEAGDIAGKVLDVGCGTGENALFLAARGLDVLGIDASTVAIAKARAKAADRGIPARFAVCDATDLPGLGETFDTAIDVLLLHVLSDGDRAKLVAGLQRVLRPGGRYHLLCFNEHTPPGLPPRRLTQDEIRATFAAGWRVESIVASEAEVLPGTHEFVGIREEAGPSYSCWLATLRRT